MSQKTPLHPSHLQASAKMVDSLMVGFFLLPVGLAGWDCKMVFEHIEKLKQEYTDKYVQIDSDRPELARFSAVVGQVKTVNMSGRALVEFQDYHLNIGWYDIDVDFLKVVDKPKPKVPEKKAKPAAKKAPAAKSAASSEKKLSPLELARMQGSAHATQRNSNVRALPPERLSDVLDLDRKVTATERGRLHAAAHHFAQRRQIRLDIKQRLSAALCDAKACHDLIEYEDRS